jgi:hypothetical protein
MKREKREKIGVRIKTMLGEIRNDFRNSPWPKNLTKDCSEIRMRN